MATRKTPVGSIQRKTPIAPINGKTSKTCQQVGSDLFLSIMKEIVLPSVCSYYRDIHGVEVSVETVAREAMNIEIETVSSFMKNNNTPQTKENPTRKRTIDEENGCQYIMERSRLRSGRKCGEKRDVRGFFCKACKKKRSFPEKAQAFADQMGISYFEATGDEKPAGVEPPQKKGVGVRRKIPEPRNAKKNMPISQPTISKNSSRIVEEPEEEININGVQIDGLNDILYDKDTGIVFICNDNDDEDIIAFGQWNEDNKITQLTQPLKATATKLGMLIGNYGDYDIGMYSVDLVNEENTEPAENEEQEEEQEEVEEEAEEEETVEEVKEEVQEAPKEEVKEVKANNTPQERKEPEARLHNIPGRRFTRKS